MGEGKEPGPWGRLYSTHARRPDDETWRMCVACNGSGEEPVSMGGVTRYVVCLACGGDGWFVPEESGE